MSIKEFFGFGGYERPAEGYFSWQHLVSVTALMAVMVFFAVYFGRRNRNRSDRDKNKVIIFSAIFINSLEIIRMVLYCFRSDDPTAWLYILPFWLCSIQMITIPLAAFTKGRIREASLDFVFIFGMLGAVLGTYFAGQNYGTYPVISYDNIHSGLTHATSGFTALYIGIAGMASMKRKNVWISSVVVTVFCIVSYIINIIIDYNYMFLMRGDGTPYDLLYNLVGGNPVLYPIGVAVLFYLYIIAFYGVNYLCEKKLHKKKTVEI